MRFLPPQVCTNFRLPEGIARIAGSSGAQGERMYKRIGTLMTAAALLAVSAAPALAQTGNGAPSGDHYNLNILGKESCSPNDLTGSNRHTIQVLLYHSDVTTTGQLATTLDKTNKIFLQEG